MLKNNREYLSKIDSFIDNSTQEIISLETQLTACQALAPENGGDGELKKAEFIESYLRSKGFTDFKRYDAADNRVSSGIRPNLVLNIQGKSSKKTIWFIAHMDVVPIGERSLWKTDPWKVVEKDGILYGRGVEDNQQGLCSAIFAALALKEYNIVPEYDLKILFCADEEVGSAYGVDYLLKNHSLFRPQDLIYIPDGGDSKGLTIEVAEKNLLWLRVHTVGKQAHGSMPDQGRNAHLAGADLLLRLNSLEKEFNIRDELFEPPYSSFQPTLKEANVPNYNSIPGDDVFGMDCRILPCYSLEQVRSQIMRHVSDVEQKYDVKVHITEPQAVESPATPVDAPVVTVLSDAIKSLTGKKTRAIGIGGGTVAAALRSNGYLNCAVWSTLDETAHQPNEYCIIENLKADAKVIARICLHS